MSPTRLHPDDLSALARLVADALAENVLAELAASLSDPAPARARLLTAAEVADRLGLSRGAVYRRAYEFGAVRIGTGPKARLRFDAEEVAAVLDAFTGSRESEAADPPPRQRSPARRPRIDGQPFPLLPVRGLK